MTLVEALSASLSGLSLKPEDRAARALAERYAEALDAPLADVVKLGPPFLATLTALGLTPAGRAAMTAKVKEVGTGDGGGGASKADELRARRAARASR